MDNYKPKKVLIIGGCFDLLHAGHLDFLARAKERCDWLIVLLEPDEKIKMLKGQNRPIEKAQIRKLKLEQTGLVNEVKVLPLLLSDQDYEKEIAKILEEIDQRNEIAFGLTSQDNNQIKNEKIKMLARKMNLKVIIVNRLLPFYSTTEKIKKM